MKTDTNNADFPSFREGLGRHITRVESICIHLSRYGGYTPHLDTAVLWAMCQGGIAHHLGDGMRRDQVSLVLKQHSELVERWHAHCRGSQRSRLVYSLTPAGRDVAAAAEAKLTKAGYDPESLFRPGVRLTELGRNPTDALTAARRAVEAIENSVEVPDLRYGAISALACAILILNRDLRR